MRFVFGVLLLAFFAGCLNGGGSGNNSSFVTKCLDGTFFDQCSTQAPLYCNATGSLVNNSLACGCPSGFTVNKTFSDCMRVAKIHISNVSLSNLTWSSVIVSWNTDEVASSQVEFSANDFSYDHVFVNSDVSVFHVRTVNGLKPNTLYHLRVVSSSGRWNEWSEDVTFTTPPA